MRTYNNPIVGDIIHVKVVGIREDLGVFVRMPNGVDGLIRLYDVAWTNQSKILSSLSIGDELDVKVIKELPDGKLNLSRKELLPNPKTTEVGTIYKTVIKRIESFGFIVQLGDYTALVPKKEIPNLNYSEGDELTCVVIGNTFNQEKHRYEIQMSVLALYDYYAKTHSEHEHIICTFTGYVEDHKSISAIIETDNFIQLIVPSKRFIEPYRTRLLNKEIELEEKLEFVFVKYNEEQRAIVLDMRPIETERKQQQVNLLRSMLHEGDIVEAVVLKVNDRSALIEISNSNVTCLIDRDELSPNKVIRASDEVFQGEHIKVAFLGMENNKLKFSRRFFVKDKYNENLYDLSLEDLLETMDLKTNRFIGRSIELNSNYFLSELITTGHEDDEQNGKLLTDPINGKNIIVIIDNRLRNFFTKGNYYEVELTLAWKEYRQEQGTPYMFSVNSNNIKEVGNPYKESVSLSFKQHTSPNTNTSVANLLEEVGQNLYTSKKRMFFELLQNADDAAPINGVQVKVHINDRFFLLTHDGFSFNRHDFESITSAAKSTKSANKKKTGYKGIGFKSVFTNSESVFIKSGGYKFSFDRNLPIYQDFKKFYFTVNDIEDDAVKQTEFLHKYAKYQREFNGVKDIPWQLLPIWFDTYNQSDKYFLFKQRENVVIALKMDEETLNEYYDAIREVFTEPRFMLFLRNTNRIQLLDKEKCLTIQKNVDAGANMISLVNSFTDDHFREDYTIFTVDNLIVDDSQFETANVYIRRKERTNNRGEKENYFVKLDEYGNEQNEVPGIPDRIASATETSISFAMRLDKDGHIIPTEKTELSLYAYLPMNERRFRFPFFLNADFIPKSDREGISDNPWNYFLFYSIGKAIVKMVSEIASTEHPQYLKLLPIHKMSTDTQDVRLLAEAFNRGYEEGLKKYEFIINDKGNKVKTESIICDKSELAELIGYDNFYTLIDTEKHLPNKNLNSDILSYSIFGVECIKKDNIEDILRSNLDSVNSWIDTTSDECRNNFYKWIAENEDCQDIIEDIHLFKLAEDWYTINDISLEEKQVITTNLYIPILPILKELGFTCSTNIFEDHPLKELLDTYIQTDKDLLNEIQKQDISDLDFEKRLLLFKTASLFTGVADVTLRSWSIFKNVDGVFSELKSMLQYDDTVPSWLNRFILCKEECCDDLLKYTVKKEDTYSSIIVPNISVILENAGIYDIYLMYSKVWQSELTLSLIKNNVENIISVVEQENDDTQSAYVLATTELSLQSSYEYDSNSYEYRWMKLAVKSDKCISHARSIITIDNEMLDKYNLKDDFVITVGGKKLKFYLSRLLPSYSSSLTLSKVSEKFSGIDGYNKIFAQREADPTSVRNQLYNHLKTSETLTSSEQFCFLISYRASQGYHFFDNTLKPYIKVNDQKTFLEILDRCFALGLGSVLSGVLCNGGITYPFSKLIGTYYNCKDYTLDSEQTPQFIVEWATSPEKLEFLNNLGLHNDQSKEIIRRKSFKENKVENIWNIVDVGIIKTFFSWVEKSFEIPIVSDNQVSILEGLYQSIRLVGTYDESDFSSSLEWDNALYHEWKKESNTKIYIIEGKLPYRGIYNNIYLFRGHTGDYTYFSSSRTIYITADREPASVLADVYSDTRMRCPFTKDDWNKIFLVSAEIVQEQNERIAELERQLEEFRNSRNDDDTEIPEYGKYTEKDNIDPETRIQINREARFAAKDYLDSIGEYDCSEWNPTSSSQIVKNEIKYNGEPITVAITSSLGRKLYLHPWVFAEIMDNPNNLLLNYGADKRIHSLKFKDVFMDNPNVNLIFDMDVISPHHMAELANKYRGSKRTCFVIENPKYSQSDEIKSFGLNEKKEGYVEIDFSDDDIFNF